MLKKLIELLPISRRKHTEYYAEVIKVLQGLAEAEANHSQIETNIIKQLQMPPPQGDKTRQPKSKKNGEDPAFQ